MGYYIQVPNHLKKADQIIELYGAKEVSATQADAAMNDPSLAVICVVNNVVFEAAGFAIDRREFDVFVTSGPERPRRWLTMDRAKAKELTNYKGV